MSHAHIQMARELGMNQQKFWRLANERQEPWKLPLPAFIAECYHKRFGRSEPEIVRSLEEVVQAKEKRHNLYLRECVSSGKRLANHWAAAPGRGAG